MGTRQHSLTSKYLTEKEAADLLGLRPATLAGWRCKSRKAGRLIGPRYRVFPPGGRAVRYAVEDVASFADGAVVELPEGGGEAADHAA